MIKVGIIGSTGYVGAELTRLLSHHSKTEIMFLDSRSYASIEYSKVYPSLRGSVEKKCTSINLDEDLENIDVLFCALPHGLSQTAVKKIVEKGKKVIDLSADFRLKDVDVYETWYDVKHEAVEELSESVYGLSEIYSEEIAKAQLIANPGCYPTSVLLPLYPLLKETIIDSSSIIIDAKSGVSGAGRAPSDANLYTQCNENIKAYGIGEHRHTPEIEQELSLAAGKELKVQFTPHLVPMTRGILSVMYMKNEKGVTYEQIEKVYEDYYGDEKFIRLLGENEYPQTKAVYGSNYCDISFKLDDRTQNIIIVSAIDNLLKGAAGQAVQNMNIMFGFNSDEGLQQAPIWP